MFVFAVELLLLAIILFVIFETLIPAFSEKEFFWLTKSTFRKKEKPKSSFSSFEEEIEMAEAAVEEAEKIVAHLHKSANKESKTAQEQLIKAKEVHEKSKKNLDLLKKREK